MGKLDENFEWLQRWYLQHCNGQWEHRFGVQIETLDNPGWSMVCDLSNTSLEKRTMKTVKIERQDDDWIFCSVAENQFRGFGGPRNLMEILEIFRVWADS